MKDTTSAVSPQFNPSVIPSDPALVGPWLEELLRGANGHSWSHDFVGKFPPPPDYNPWDYEDQAPDAPVIVTEQSGPWHIPTKEFIVALCNLIRSERRIKPREVATAVLDEYTRRLQEVPGAVAPCQLSPEKHVRAILHIGDFRVDVHHDFTTFVLQFFTPRVEDAYNRSGYAKSGRVGLYTAATADGFESIRDRLKQIPGAPLPGDVTVASLWAAVESGEFIPELDHDWSGYFTRYKREQDALWGQMDYHTAPLSGKTDDRPSDWERAVRGLPDEAIERVKKLLNGAAPPRTGTHVERLKRPFVSDPATLDVMVEALIKHLDIIVFDKGDVEDQVQQDFNRRITLSLMVGLLGLDAARRIFRAIFESAESEPVYDYYAKCTDDELVEAALNSYKLAGLPLSLLRVPFLPLHKILSEIKPPLPKAPFFYAPVLLIDILLHTRFYEDLGGAGPHIFVAFDGNPQTVPVSAIGLSQSIGMSANTMVKEVVCRILGISVPQRTAGNRNDPLIGAALWLLDRIKPTDLPRPVQPSYTLIVPPAVSVLPCRKAFAEYRDRIGNPGVVITDIAKLNVETGIVETGVTLSGTEAFTALPHKRTATPEALANHRSNVAGLTVESIRPSELIRRVFGNIDDLGIPAGWAAIYDSGIFLDLLRQPLAGCRIGDLAARREHPTYLSLPAGGSLEGSSNSGKTLFNEVTANAVVPGIGNAVNMKTGVDPASQRQCAAQLRELHSALFQEFLVPRPCSGHFLEHGGWVSLMTGGTLTPGEVLKNNSGVRLEHLMFCDAKSITTEFKDVLSRVFSTFFLPLTPETRCSSDQLADMGCGRLSLQLRLSALRFAHETDLVNRIRRLSLIPGTWRHEAHMAVAAMLAGSAEPVDAYLNAMVVRMKEQDRAAARSGLTEAWGGRRGFEFEDSWENCNTNSLKHAAQQGVMRIAAGLRWIVEETARDALHFFRVRKLEDLLDKTNLSLNRACQKVSERLREGDLVREEDDGIYTMSYVPPDQSGKRGKGHKHPGVKFTYKPSEKE
ncbi:MAG TPA: hypothetical protein VGP72_05575 [Planctomycetota bacterium]|jgi:hypothetical protein